MGSKKGRIGADLVQEFVFTMSSDFGLLGFLISNLSVEHGVEACARRNQGQQYWDPCLGLVNAKTS